MLPKVMLPLSRLSNGILILEGVYVYANLPQVIPDGRGPYSALIDTGSSNSWVKPKIGNQLAPYNYDDLVIDPGDGTERDIAVDIKFGFQTGLRGTPVKGWVQLDRQLAAYNHLFLSGDFPAQTDLLIGMDILLSFAQSSIIICANQGQYILIEDKT